MLDVVAMPDLLRKCRGTWKLSLLVAPKENIVALGRMLSYCLIDKFLSV